MKNGMDAKKIDVRLVLKLSILPLTIILTVLFSSFPWLTEIVYSRFIYFLFSTLMGFLTFLLPFSLSEIILILIIPAIIALIIYQIIQRKKKAKPDWKKRIMNFLVNLAFALGMVLLIFQFIWGFNYYRPSFDQLAGWNGNVSLSKMNLEELNIMLLSEIEEQIERFEDNFPTEYALREYYTLNSQALIKESYLSIYGKYPFLQTPLNTAPYPVKPAMLSGLLSLSGTGGVFSPFTMESHLNKDMPAFSKPFVAAHEMAHQLGIANESEANLISYLVCMNTEDPYIQYSALLSMHLYCINSLYRENPDAALELIKRRPRTLSRNLDELGFFWDQFEGPVQDGFNAVYDSYLKAQGLSDGIRNYQGVVRLLLIYYNQ